MGSNQITSTASSVDQSNFAVPTQSRRAVIKSLLYNISMLNPPNRAQILRVHRALIALYGNPKPHHRRDALSQLVHTILSQSNTDVNTDRTFANLRARFPTWEQVRDAPRRDVVRAIRSAGLANTKAPRIQTILRQLSRERGKLSLNFLRIMPVEDARNYLLGLRGWDQRPRRLCCCSVGTSPSSP